MSDTEEITLLTLILRRKCRKKKIYSATRSKLVFWVRDVFTRREQQGEFYRLG